MKSSRSYKSAIFQSPLARDFPGLESRQHIFTHGERGACICRREGLMFAPCTALAPIQHPGGRFLRGVFKTPLVSMEIQIFSTRPGKSIYFPGLRRLAQGARHQGIHGWQGAWMDSFIHRADAMAAQIRLHLSQLIRRSLRSL